MRFHERGYIALITILILGAVSLTVATTLLAMGANSQRSAIVSQSSTQARGLAMTCADQALQEIRNNLMYSGSGNLFFGQGTCTYSVAIQAGGSRQITVSGAVDSTVSNIQVYATIGTSSISITSWQEII